MENPIIEISDNPELFDRQTLPKSEKSYNVGNETKVTTAYPVIVDGKQVSEKVYSYAFGDKKNDNTYLGNPFQQGSGLNTGLTTTDFTKNRNVELGTTTDGKKMVYADWVEQQKKAGVPSAEEQADKAKKERKFWDNASKSWGKFKDSPGGQFALQQALNYLQMRLDGGQGTGGGSDNYVPEPEKKDNTVWYVLGGVAIIGILALVLMKSKKPEAGA
jgi:hypothetical protein